MAASDAIGTVWIDNPPLNVLTPALSEALGAELARLAAGCRVLVLRGRGERAFSAGADLTSFQPGSGPPAALHELGTLIESLACPVVAAIHGYCLGGGLELALACDVRVAQAGATLGLPEATLGLVPGGGGSQRLPRLIGRGRAAWLILSGERLDAEQAERWGLVEFVTAELDEGIARVAGVLATRSRSTLARAKALLRETRGQASDAAELVAFEQCLASADGQEGIAAFREKRAPRWSQG